MTVTEEDKDHALHQYLRRYGTPGRIDELRQEGQEKQRHPCSRSTCL